MQLNPRRVPLRPLDIMPSKNNKPKPTGRTVASTSQPKENIQGSHAIKSKARMPCPGTNVFSTQVERPNTIITFEQSTEQMKIVSLAVVSFGTLAVIHTPDVALPQISRIAFVRYFFVDSLAILVLADQKVTCSPG